MATWNEPIIEREFQRGRIVLASPESLKPVLLDTTKIAAWGSHAVSCCVVANGLDSHQVGVARRSVLSPAAGKSAHLVVSETLVAVRNSPLKTFMTFSLTDPMLAKKASHADTLKEQQIDLLKKAADSGDKASPNSNTSVGGGNNSNNNTKEAPVIVQKTRRPPHPSDAVPGALYMDTTISLCPVESDPEKSFVEIFVEFAAPDAGKADEIGFFLERCWVGPLLTSLADYALNVSFPVQKGPTDLEFRKLYEKHEETVVKICAKKHIDDELKERTEALLDALYASYRDSVAAQALTEHMKSELHSAQLLLREAHQKIAQQENDLNLLQGKLLLAEHAVVQAGGGGGEAGNDSESNNNNTPKQQAVNAPADHHNASSSNGEVVVASSASPDASLVAAATPTPTAQREQVVLRGANASDKAAFTLTPEQRSRQVVSSISEFGVSTASSVGGARASSSMSSQQQASAATPAGGSNSSGRVFGNSGRAEAALRAKFDALDVDRVGHLNVEHVVQLLAAVDPADDFDVKERLERERQKTPRGRTASQARAELENPARNPREAVHYREALEWCEKNCADRTGKRVAFSEFCVLMCKLERSI